MEPFSIKKRLKSFTYAGKGIKSFVCREHNVWIHLSIALLTIMAGFFFEIHRIEWIAIIISALSLQQKPSIRLLKDWSILHHRNGIR